MNRYSREQDAAGFVLLSDYVPQIIQEIRYFSTYNFVGDRIDGYEQPIAILTKEAARALKNVSNEMNAKGFRLKIFDAYRPVSAVRHFILWGIEDQDLRMKPFFTLTWKNRNCLPRAISPNDPGTAEEARWISHCWI